MFCAKCGKEIADDSWFCTSCGCATNKSNALPIVESSRVSAPKRRIRAGWIIIGLIIVILTVVILGNRNSPENKSARVGQKGVEKAKGAETSVSWSEVKKSWADAKKARQDLDKSLGELKSEWDGFKRQVNAAFNDAKANGEMDRPIHGATAEELKSVVLKSKKFEKSLDNSLDNKDLQNAADDLKTALQD